MANLDKKIPTEMIEASFSMLLTFVTLAVDGFLQMEENIYGTMFSSDPNTAEAGTYTETAVLGLYFNNVLQTWFNGSITLEPTGYSIYPPIQPPTIVGGNTVNFVNGVAIVNLLFDTDAGNTKIYIEYQGGGFGTSEIEILGSIVPMVYDFVYWQQPST